MSTNSNLRHPTRLACGLIPLLNMLQEFNIDSKDILLKAGIRKAEFIDPAFTITLEQELRIIDNALSNLPPKNLSLQLAKHYHLHHFSVLGLALRSCPNLEESFALTRRFPRLMWGICASTGNISNNILHFELSAGTTRVEQFLLERDMACIKTLFDEVLNGELNLLEVTFSHAEPNDKSSYEAFFNCPVLFGQKISGLSMNIAELARLIPTADALSLEFYEAQCARISAEIDEPFRFTFLIRDHLSRLTPMPSFEELANLLEFEPRTLQRHLKKENSTFSDILKEVRFKRATDRLLYSKYSAEKIAAELGFNDAVAFSHAFKEWTNTSPRQWKANQLK